jgi:hypothetical protein
LHKALLTSTLPNNIVYEKNKPNGLSKFDFYIVSFRVVLNKDNNGGYKSVLVYNYLPYNVIFSDVLLQYLITKHRFSNSITFEQYGNFYTIIDDNIGSSNELITEIKASPNKYNEHLNYNSEINNMYEHLDNLDYSKKFVTITDINNMYNLLNLLYNKDYENFIFSYLKSVKVKDNIDFNPNQLNLDLNIDIDVNLLNSCLFIIKDLEAFIGIIKKNNIEIGVNQGPQPRRGCHTTMHNFHSYLDVDFRNCMYKHNTRFSENYSKKLFLYKNRFSYQNIHMNLGNVR